MRQGRKLKLWFGSGALPGNVAAVSEMVDCAIKGGIDTFEAAPVIVAALKKYPRDSYRLFARCDIYGLDECDAGAWLERQRDALAIDRFDCVMLTDLNEATSNPAYGEERQLASLGEKRSQGAVEHVGVHFSGGFRALKDFLDRHGQGLDFCCVQFNYMDWSLQRAREKAAILSDFGLPLIAAKPLRGGLLESLPPNLDAELSSARPGEGALDWGVNWLKAQDTAAAIVDARCKDELAAYIRASLLGKELNPEEQCLLYYVAGELRHIEEAPPCTDCPHCAGICPAGLDIPSCIGLLTDLKVQRDEALVRQYRSLPPERRASACVGCFKCVFSCPKQILVPVLMAELEELTVLGGSHIGTA